MDIRKAKFTITNLVVPEYVNVGGILYPHLGHRGSMYILPDTLSIITGMGKEVLLDDRTITGERISIFRIFPQAEEHAVYNTRTQGFRILAKYPYTLKVDVLHSPTLTDVQICKWVSELAGQEKSSVIPVDEFVF